jgi:arginine/lysine/ornithine decarboxylase
VAAAHARRVPVHADEAWGPHLGFHPALPEGAMAAGADGAVTSAHKVLSSLSQSSRLNVDARRQQLAADGEALVGRALELADDARRRLRMLPGVDVLGPDRLGLGSGRFDPSSWSSTPPGWACAAIGPSGCCASASPSPRAAPGRRRRGRGRAGGPLPAGDPGAGPRGR